ncbi:MAG: hypothetical protein ACE5KV_04440 [Thermoplasmata archaeon]
MDEELTEDQKRLLILLSRYTKPAASRKDEETWIKKIPLGALINRGIRTKVFKGYDIVPALVDYLGTTRYANVSKEGEDDVADLREMELLERLKLATSRHIYVSAYRITRKGMTLVPSLEKRHHDVIDWLVNCRKCGNRLDIEAREDAPYLLCRECRTKEKVPIFDIEELAYASSPFFSPIWLPPD